MKNLVFIIFANLAKGDDFRTATENAIVNNSTAANLYNCSDDLKKEKIIKSCIYSFKNWLDCLSINDWYELSEIYNVDIKFIENLL